MENTFYCSPYAQSIILSKDVYNPFHDDFSIEDISLQLLKDSPFYEDKSNLILLCGFLKALNDMHYSLIVEIEEYISEIGVIEELLLDFFIAEVNCSHFNIIEARKNIALNNKSSFSGIESQFEVMGTNIFGRAVDLDVAGEVGIDVLSELITLFETVEFDENTNRKFPPESTILPLVRNVILGFNIIINLKNIYEQAIYLGKFVSVRERTYFLHLQAENNFSILHKIGMLREHNLSKEGDHYAEKLFRQKEFSPNRLCPKVKVQKNRLTYKLVKQSMPRIVLYQLRNMFTLFYPHLISLNLKPFDVPFEAFLSIHSELVELLAAINPFKTLNKTVKNQSIRNIPTKISHKSLFDYLLKTSSLPKKFVAFYLNLISTEQDEKINFWETPVIKNPTDYILLFHPLVNGHPNRIIDYFLTRSKVSKEKEAELLRNFLIKEITGNISQSKYSYSVTKCEEEEDISVNDKSILIIKLGATRIIAKVVCYKYPYDAYTQYIAKEQIEKYSSIFLSSLQDVEKKETDILILLTNHTRFSGMTFYGIKLIDYTLLNNYLNKGFFEHNRIMTNRTKESTTTRVTRLYQKDYYSTQEEFEQNLSKFLDAPYPIYSKQNMLSISTSEASLPESYYTFIIEDLRVTSTEEQVSNHQLLIEGLLNRKHYFPESVDESFYSEVEQYIPFIIDYLALESPNALIREDIVKIFEDVKLDGFALLTHQIVVALNRIYQIEKIKDEFPDLEIPDYEEEKNDEVIDIIQDWFSKNTEEIEAIQLSTFKVTHNLNKQDFLKVVGYSKELLNILGNRAFSKDLLQDLIHQLVIFYGLYQQDNRLERQFQIYLANYVDILNLNHEYQAARDFCEEIQLLASRENWKTFGWQILFVCYTKQHSPHRAALFGAAYLSSIESAANVYERDIPDVLFYTILFFRNFRFFSLAKEVFNKMQELDVDNYTSQRFHLSYYNGLLRSGIIVEEISKAIEYLETNLNEIIFYGHNGAIPWLAFLYSIISNNIGTEEERIRVNALIIELEKEVEEQTLNHIKGQFMAELQVSKDLFIKSLIKISQTRSFNDYSVETTNLNAHANNLLELSLFKQDIDGIFLCGTIINDAELHFVENFEKEGKATRWLDYSEPELETKFSNYGNYILDNLELSEGQILVWIFHNKGRIRAIVIDSSKQPKLLVLDNWTLQKTYEWSTEIQRFRFKDGDYPINAQEDDYQELLSNVMFAELNIESDFKELLICFDRELSVFPHNLLPTKYLSEGDFNKHPEDGKIRPLLQDGHPDFISLHHPVTNIFSIETFILNQSESTVELNIEAWIPKEEDTTLWIGYNKSKEIIEKYNGKILTDIIPKEQIKGAINIFLAHGDNEGIDGFRGVYPNSEKLISPKKGIRYVFGSGDIAIMFICSSAYTQQSFYRESLNSFTKTAMQLGYKAVISSFWKLNVDIVNVWLTEFLNVFSGGVTVSVAVYQANLKVFNSGFNEYHGFYAPKGWAAMHLYGNPNLKIQT